MNTPDTSLDLTALADRWWLAIARGVAAIAFSFFTLLWPGITLIALVTLFGAYVLLDGLFALMLAYKATREGGRWGGLVLEGILSLAAGAITFVWPGITALYLLSLIAAWAVLTGGAEIYAAIKLRKQLRGEWLFITSGVVSILFGVLMVVFPGAGTLALVWMIGEYAFVFGVLLVGLGLRLHGLGRPGRRELPSGGTPTHA